MSTLISGFFILGLIWAFRTIMENDKPYNSTRVARTHDNAPEPPANTKVRKG